MLSSWCQHHQLHLFAARPADLELFARDLEARGRARATIARRLCTVAGFYRYAVEEELLDHSPAALPEELVSPEDRGRAGSRAPSSWRAWSVA